MSIHPHYKMQASHLERADDFQPSLTDGERGHTIHIGDGMELAFVLDSSKSQSDVLRVGFHAAKSVRDRRDHMFSPLTMARQHEDSYLLFSDPTLTLSNRTLLSWYLGTPDINPDDWMEYFVRRAMEAFNAKYLLIEGSSGGGFTALRFAARFRNAIAVPRIPQTDLFRYTPGPVSHTMQDAGWSGWTYDKIMAECPQRFRIADIYNDKSRHRGNLIDYVQNTGDQTHLLHQFHPFLLETGSKNEHVFSALRGQVTISRPFTGTGHKPIPRAYWNAENDFAIRRLRALRPNPQSRGIVCYSPSQPNANSKFSSARSQHRQACSK